MMTTVCDAAFYSILSKINITSFFYFNCIYWDFLWYLERSGHGLNWMKSMEKMQYFTHVPTSNHIHIQSFLSVSSINFYDSFDISGNIEYWKQNYVQLEWFFLSNSESRFVEMKTSCLYEYFALKWFTWHWLCMWNFSYRACALTQIKKWLQLDNNALDSFETKRTESGS